MNNRIQDQSRRRFLAALTGAGVALIFNPFTSWAMDDIDPKVTGIVARTIGIDTHNHIDVPFRREDFDVTEYALSNEIKKSGLTAICMTFCVDRPALTKEGEAYERFILSLDKMDEMLKAIDVTRALNYADLKKARKENKPIVVQSVEGGHFIDGKLERIEIAYRRGLRHLGLLHDNQSSVPLGDIYTDPPRFGGLTEMGVSVIKECNRLGILVDLAHCSKEAVNKGIEISTTPIIISHTGLNSILGTNENMNENMLPRLISKEQAKIVANAGGVIGVWSHFAETPLQYAQSIRAMVDIVGVEHVGIGTDTKMAIPPTTNERMGRTTNETFQNETRGFFYAMVSAMLKLGFTENEIVAIGGGNYCRVFEKATGIE